MIIISDRPGQLGNQLWAYSNMIAISKECNTGIIIILRRDYYNALDTKNIQRNSNVKLFADDSFAGKRIKWAIGFFTYRIKQKGVFSFIITKFPVLVIDKLVLENVFKNTYKKHHYYFINSWEQRYNKQFFQKHSAFIKTLITPLLPDIGNVHKTIKLLKANDTIIVGVHIRRGDYKHFLKGKYYFENNVYIQYMRQFQALFLSQKINFYIFSNEKIDVHDFGGLDVYFKDDQMPVSDLWAMSQCDYILGPLSTFSMWASFWKQVPLYFISNSEEKLNLDLFKPIVALGLFKEN